MNIAEVKEQYTMLKQKSYTKIKYSLGKIQNRLCHENHTNCMKMNPKLMY